MQVTREGSVRVDLVGGTLDLEPINLIIPKVVTLNVATSLKAKVLIESHDKPEIIINSKDYKQESVIALSELNEQNLYIEPKFEHLNFVLQILDQFDLQGKGLKLNLSSGAPAGSGLGGSSAMGVTLYNALCEYFQKETNTLNTIKTVKSIEGRILNKGMPGYQDYFPALTGGVLALIPKCSEVTSRQLFTEELKIFLENHIYLIYSGISRNSGINNWDVYKSYFDGDEEVRSALHKIADISYKTLESIQNKNFADVIRLIGDEGEARKHLSENIVPRKVQDFFQELKAADAAIGIKMCGAGGGGCFILTHNNSHPELIESKIKEFEFEKLDFSIESPLNE